MPSTNQKLDNFPRISIITPSYNQGQYLEATIKSVLEQNYPNLEYLILDAGSTDNSVAIIKKYAQKYPKIVKWRSRHDKGQVFAINEGLKKATGEILAFLNSDDMYAPDTLIKVVSGFAAYPHKSWLTGLYHRLPESTLISTYVAFWLRLFSRNLLLILNLIPQPSTFWRRSALEKIGFLNPDYKFAFDYDYWLRLSNLGDPIILNSVLSIFRIHTFSKSSLNYRKQFVEQWQIVQKTTSNWGILILHWLHTHLLILPIYNLIAYTNEINNG